MRVVLSLSLTQTFTFLPRRALITDNTHTVTRSTTMRCVGKRPAAEESYANRVTSYLTQINIRLPEKTPCHAQRQEVAALRRSFIHTT